MTLVVMLISKTFNGMKLEFTPASAFATADGFLFLLRNIYVLSGTSSTSIDLKTKTSMRHSPSGYTTFIKRRKGHLHSLYNLGAKSLSHPHLSQGKHCIHFTSLIASSVQCPKRKYFIALQGSIIKTVIFFFL